MRRIRGNTLFMLLAVFNVLMTFTVGDTQADNSQTDLKPITEAAVPSLTATVTVQPYTDQNSTQVQQNLPSTQSGIASTPSVHGTLSLEGPSASEGALATQLPAVNTSRNLAATPQGKSPGFVVSFNPEKSSASKLEVSLSLPTVTNMDIVQPSMTMDIFQSAAGSTLVLEASKDLSVTPELTSYLPSDSYQSPFPTTSSTSPNNNASEYNTDVNVNTISIKHSDFQDIQPTSTLMNVLDTQAVPSHSLVQSSPTWSEAWKNSSGISVTEAQEPRVSSLGVSSPLPEASTTTETRYNTQTATWEDHAGVTIAPTPSLIVNASGLLSQTEVLNQTMTDISESTTVTSPLPETLHGVFDGSSGTTTLESAELSLTILTSSTVDVTMVTAYVTTTESPAPRQYTVKAKLTLSGNCSVMDDMESADGMEEFKRELAMALKNELNFPANQIRIKSISCGSIIVLVHFVNVTEAQNLENSLQTMTEKDLFTTSNNTYSFSLLRYEPIDDVPTKPTTKTKMKKKKPLTQVQIIVIIVCSVVGGTLLVYAFGFCIYACYQKKKTKSFDLGETPGYNLNMDDFTLTKMQRPPPTYGEYGVAIPGAQNGKPRKGSKKNGHYQAIEDEMQCLAPEDIHLASTLPRRSPAGDPTQTPIHSNGSATLGHEEHLQHAASGFDNPSFSSDDILDSGPDTDQELPLDTEQSQTATHNGHNGHRNGYQNSEQATHRYTHDQIKGEGATAF